MDSKMYSFIRIMYAYNIVEIVANKLASIEFDMHKLHFLRP